MTAVGGRVRKLPHSPADDGLPSMFMWNSQSPIAIPPSTRITVPFT